MTSRSRLFLIPGLLATSAALCAFNPQSYLDGNPRTKTDNQLYPVLVVGVDGVRPHANPVAVTPGPHWLEIRYRQPTPWLAGERRNPRPSC